MGFRDWWPWRSEKRTLTLEKFREFGLLDTPTAAGVTVTEKTALTFAAYWSAVNLIAGAIAKLPRKVYRKLPDDTREEVPQHPVAWLVQIEPSEFSAPLVFWRTLMGHVLTWGNGYAEIERDGATRPIGLLTILPDLMVPKIEGGRLVYIYGGARRLSPDDVFHVPGLGYDGIQGYSVVQMAKQSLGLGLAAERYGATFFGNGAMPGMTLEHPAKLTDEAQARLRASWEAAHQGVDRAHRVAILEEGMKANPLSIPAKDAQLIDTREIQVMEVARWMNLNPAFLGKSGDRPGGNYESGRLDFLDNTLDPWLVAIEQECNRKLISTTQRGTYYVEHVRNAVLRTDAQTRANVQKTYVDMGVMSPEYVAKIENLPKPEPKPVTAPPAPTPPPDDEDDERARQAWRRMIAHVVGGLTKLEAERARRAASQGPLKFQVWVEEFYPAHQVRLREALEPAVRGWCELRGTDDWRVKLDHVAWTLASRSREELLGVKAAALVVDVEARMGRWERERPDEAARMILEVA